LPWASPYCGLATSACTTAPGGSLVIVHLPDDHVEPLGTLPHGHCIRVGNQICNTKPCETPPRFEATNAYSPPCSTLATGVLRVIPLSLPRRHKGDQRSVLVRRFKRRLAKHWYFRNMLRTRSEELGVEREVLWRLTTGPGWDGATNRPGRHPARAFGPRHPLDQPAPRRDAG